MKDKFFFFFLAVETQIERDRDNEVMAHVISLQSIPMFPTLIFKFTALTWQCPLHQPDNQHLPL